MGRSVELRLTVIVPLAILRISMRMSAVIVPALRNVGALGITNTTFAGSEKSMDKKYTETLFNYLRARL